MITVEDANESGLADVIRFDFSGASGWYFLVLIISVLVYTTIMAGLFSKVVLRTAEFPSPHALVTSLTMLTFVALTAAIATNSAALETIAATGMGAIAGALSHVFTRTEIPDDPDEKEEDE